MPLPTPADVVRFNAHAARRALRCPCCSTDDFTFLRIAHAQDLADPDTATPLALVMCRGCYRVETFAWLPIAEASAPPPEPAPARA